MNGENMRQQLADETIHEPQILKLGDNKSHRSVHRLPSHLAHHKRG